MNKENLVTVAIIVCIVAISIFASKPAVSKAAVRLSPVPTPSPRKIRPKTIQSPRSVKPARNSPRSSGDQPEMQVTSAPNNRPVKKPKNQDIEVENDETHVTQNPAYREGGVNDSTVKRQNQRPPRQPATPSVLKIEGIDGEVTAPSTTPKAAPSPCPTNQSNVKLPKSNRSSKQAANKNCQEFEAVRPNSPQTPDAAQYNPKELSVDKVVKKKPAKTKRP